MSRGGRGYADGVETVDKLDASPLAAAFDERYEYYHSILHLLPKPVSMGSAGSYDFQ